MCNSVSVSLDPSWLTGTLEERSRAYTNPPESDGCCSPKCSRCHLFDEGCMDMRLRKAFEAGARSERAMLRRWRDPAEERPALPVPGESTKWVELLVEYVGASTLIEIGYNCGCPQCDGWFIRGMSGIGCGVKVIGWRPLL